MDQLTKSFFVETQSINIFDWFNFKLSLNDGSAFSLQIPFWLTIGLGVIFAIAILIYPWFMKRNNKLGEMVLVAIIGGGVFGNTIDRIFYGYVVDFIQVGWWPIFNLADVYLTVGVTGLIIIDLLRSKTKLTNKK